MGTKLFARIGAGAFVAMALTMSVLGLREEPTVPPTETVSVWVPDGDPLPAQLRVCASMGELALSSPDCRAAWAEKRRRLLGVDSEASDPSADAPLPPPPSTEPPATKAQ